ncbi:unnamed protein product [Lepeophtheirus salmonis]|uniref:(salmon louse) hypothetical protein n=1 Tax=Lepeophtheirus salmonis TaxID=72036 RepID=A0A7R8GZN3_LEPSM|nr:unnamed protein product [Lepeophtheirus salmonis]CAF2755554.1 unnamed protein product [Lepeophtheirus salmonis]
MQPHNFTFQIASAGRVQFQDPQSAPIIEQEEEEAEKDIEQVTKSNEEQELIRNNNGCAPGEDDVINDENTTNENADEVEKTLITKEHGLKDMERRNDNKKPDLASGTSSQAEEDAKRKKTSKNQTK